MKGELRIYLLDQKYFAFGEAQGPKWPGEIGSFMEDSFSEDPRGHYHSLQTSVHPLDPTDHVWPRLKEIVEKHHEIFTKDVHYVLSTTSFLPLCPGLYSDANSHGHSFTAVVSPLEKGFEISIKATRLQTIEIFLAKLFTAEVNPTKEWVGNGNRQ